MPASNICRLCFKESVDVKSLYHGNGQPTELFKMTHGYFHPKIINMEEAKHLTVLCQVCFRHIYDFHSFQAFVSVAQLKLLEDRTEAREAVKVEQDVEIWNEVENPNLSNVNAIKLEKENSSMSFEEVLVDTDDDMELTAGEGVYLTKKKDQETWRLPTPVVVFEGVSGHQELIIALPKENRTNKQLNKEDARAPSSPLTEGSGTSGVKKTNVRVANKASQEAVQVGKVGQINTNKSKDLAKNAPTIGYPFNGLRNSMTEMKETETRGVPNIKLEFDPTNSANDTGSIATNEGQNTAANLKNRSRCIPLACSKADTGETQVATHNKSGSGVQVAQTDDPSHADVKKRFECFHCGISYVFKHTLQLHLRKKHVPPLKMAIRRATVLAKEDRTKNPVNSEDSNAQSSSLSKDRGIARKKCETKGVKKSNVEQVKTSQETGSVGEVFRMNAGLNNDPVKNAPTKSFPFNCLANATIKEQGSEAIGVPKINLDTEPIKAGSIEANEGRTIDVAYANLKNGCQAVSSRATEVATHSKKALNETGSGVHVSQTDADVKKRFKCSQCGKSYVFKHTLQLHLKRKHVPPLKMVIRKATALAKGNGANGEDSSAQSSPRAKDSEIAGMNGATRGVKKTNVVRVKAAQESESIEKLTSPVKKKKTEAKGVLEIKPETHPTEIFQDSCSVETNEGKNKTVDDAANADLKNKSQCTPNKNAGDTPVATQSKVASNEFVSGLHESQNDDSGKANVEKRFQCNYCSNSYVFKQTLQMHLKRKHIPAQIQVRRKSHRLSITQPISPEKSADERNALPNLECDFKGKTKRFKCSFCEKSYALKNRLLLHTERHHWKTHRKNEATHACTKCKRKFSSKDKLETHCELFHPQAGVYTCNGCDKTCTEWETFRNHVLCCQKQQTTQSQANLEGEKCTVTKSQSSATSTNEAASAVTTPTTSTTAAPALVLQDQTLDWASPAELSEDPLPACKFKCDETKDKFKCKLCNNNFKTKRLLKMHTRAQHNIPEQVTKCDGSALSSNQNAAKCETCGNTFRSKHSLRFHLKQQHPDIKPTMFSADYDATTKRFKCRLCHMLFLRQTSLTKHMRRRHKQEFDFDYNETTRKYSCRICCQSYKKSRHLVSHMETLHPEAAKTTASQPVAEKRFQCKSCDKAFGTALSLQSHMERQHGWAAFESVNDNGTMSFKCNLCNNSYSSKWVLRKHIRDQHLTKTNILSNDFANDETTNMFQCKGCDHTFKHKANLMRHIVQKHDKMPASNNKCQKCGKCFLTQHRLAKYEFATITTAEVNQALPPAKRSSNTFGDRLSLGRHKCRRIGRPQYTRCDVCGKMLKKLSALRLHLAAHMRNDQNRATTDGSLSKIPPRTTLIESSAMKELNENI